MDTNVPQLMLLAALLLFVVWLARRLLSKRVGRLVCLQKGHKRRSFKRKADGYVGYCRRCGQRLWKAHRSDEWTAVD